MIEYLQNTKDMKKPSTPKAKKKGKNTKCYEHSKEWTVYVEGIGNVKCRRMCSKDERETINYLLHQEGARPSGRSEIVHIQLDE